jgi:hypothetical protein
VLDALRNLIDPDFNEDIVACGFVKDLVADSASGKVRRLQRWPVAPAQEQLRDGPLTAPPLLLPCRRRRRCP